MKVLCIIGPTGSGKSSIVDEMNQRGLIVVTPTYTDRPKRPQEIELEHRFVSSKVFDALISNNKFLDTVQLFGLPYRYGLPPVIEQKGKVSLVMLRAPLISKMKAVYPDIVVYQVEAPIDLIKNRLNSRPEIKGTRLSDYQAELELGRKIADRTYINDRDMAELLNIIETDIKQDF